MKKIILGLVMVFMFLLIPSNVFAENDSTIYVFRGYSCSHCEEALTYINEHLNEINSRVKIVTYEVWKNTNNAKLEEAVATKLGIDTSSKDFGVPFIVIGNEYITGYNGVVTFNKIVKLAEDNLDNDEYKDVVEEAINELKSENEKIKFKSESLEDVFPKPNKVVTIVIYSIFGVIILGGLGMILFSRK